MLVIPIKTRTFLPPKDDILPTLERVSKRLREGDILVVTSKIVSIAEGRCVPATTPKAKRKLIEQESESTISFGGVKDVWFSVKGHTVIASAGIDDSNGNGYWILWPKHPMHSAKEIWNFVRKASGRRNIGVIITDSYCTPMRAGTIGISIGFYGFHPVADHIGKKDIFGRTFNYSKSNVTDGIAAAAVAVMGETTERVPMVIVRGAPQLKFTTKDVRDKLFIDPKKDIYYPLLKPLYARKKK